MTAMINDFACDEMLDPNNTYGFSPSGNYTMPIVNLDGSEGAFKGSCEDYLTFIDTLPDDAAPEV